MTTVIVIQDLEHENSFCFIAMTFFRVNYQNTNFSCESHKGKENIREEGDKRQLTKQVPVETPIITIVILSITQTMS